MPPNRKAERTPRRKANPLHARRIAEVDWKAVGTGASACRVAAS